MNLDAVFYPKKLAVIGVSTRPNNLARNILANLFAFEYDGEIYPVGRGGGVIYGKKIHQSVADIPSEIDTAVILTPATTVPDYVEQCGEKGVRAVVIESGGFTEYGPEGKALSDRIAEIAARYEMRVVGPNGIGVINTTNGLAVPFARLDPVVAGPVTVLSQSGGVGISYLQELHNENVGVAKFVSLGNKIDVDETDLLRYLKNDEDTKIVCCYLESIPRGRTFFEMAKEVGKPILVHKSNVGKLANRIARSHTASLVTDDRVVDAAMEQAGIVRVDEVRTMVNDAMILTLPLFKGPRLAILSRSGGHGVIAADACEEVGFKLPSFPEKILNTAKDAVRANVIDLDNPMDLGDLYDVEAFKKILTATLAEDRFDGVLFLFAYYSKGDTEVPKVLIRHMMAETERTGKPIAFCLLSYADLARELKAGFQFPIFTTTEEAVAALAASHNYYRWTKSKRPQPRRPKVDRAKAAGILAGAKDEGRGHLASEAFGVLEAYGIPVLPRVLAANSAEAARAVEQFGRPCVLKIESEDVVHKADSGGVILNVETGKDARAAYKRMMRDVKKAYPKAGIDGALVMPMVRGGYELIVGTNVVETFGPVLLLGWGGALVEVLSQTVLRLAPVTSKTASEMIERLSARAILSGVRGRKPADLAALKDALVRLSWLAADFPEIAEMDVNPLLVLPEKKGAVALDARILLTDEK